MNELKTILSVGVLYIVKIVEPKVVKGIIIKFFHNSNLMVQGSRFWILNEIL